jgi:hypothetical protein
MYTTRTKIRFPDEKFRQFVAAYPAPRRMTNANAKRAFARAVHKVPFAVLLHALEQHKRSEQWQEQIIPSMLKWLTEERWLQTLPEPKRSAAEAKRLHNRLTPNEHARRLGLK